MRTCSQPAVPDSQSWRSCSHVLAVVVICEVTSRRAAQADQGLGGVIHIGPSGYFKFEPAPNQNMCDLLIYAI